MSGSRVGIYGGVDTHRDIHVAVVVDGVGRVVGSESFRADESGYGRMVAWFRARGALVRVGVEGCGSYGAGLARYLTAAHIEVVEVNRPNRQLRRQRGGKTDSVDAEAADRAAASGQATAVPKSGDGPVECIRMLVVARLLAVHRRMASIRLAAHRPGSRRSRTSTLGPATRCGRSRPPSGSSFRRRQPIPVHPLQHAAGGSRHLTVGRISRRLLTPWPNQSSASTRPLII